MARRPVDREVVEELQNASDAELQKIHRALISDVYAQVARLQREQRALANSLDSDLRNRLFFRRDTEGVTSASKKAVSRAVNKASSEGERAFERRLSYAVAKISLEKARAVADALRDRGFTPPSTSRIDAIAKSIAKDDSVSFGSKPSARVKRILAAHRTRIDGLVTEQIGEPSPAVAATAARQRILTAGSAGTWGAHTPGGAVIKDMTRLVVSETMRKSYETERAVMSAAGVLFAYRRLSAEHEFRGRVELCEELNAAIVDDIEESLRAAGYDPDALDLRGLYRVDEMPHYPHSYCRCWAEPLPPP